MKKKIFMVALILALVSVVVFAADASVSYTTNSVTVKAPRGTTIAQVDVCVMYKDAAGIQRETSISFYNVNNIGQTKSFNIGKVIGAYSSYCATPVTD